VEDTYARDHRPSRVSADRYADYVQLQSGPRKIILVEHEQDALKAGIMEFGLTLDEASTMLRKTADVHGLALESQVEKHMETFLVEHCSRRDSRRSGGGDFNRKRFEQAVDLYQTLTRSALPRQQARKRVKEMADRLGFEAESAWLSTPASSAASPRKWLDRLKPLTPPTD
jgi:hypothetical protein